ncbi:hypothetical protein, partial [Methylophaga sp. UBA5088]|uniref:hypothetical protein n=1 Tax=Methylophaga sp. UBA5088 TaxID=1946898 RepID=UPI00259D275C
FYYSSDYTPVENGKYARRIIKLGHHLYIHLFSILTFSCNSAYLHYSWMNNSPFSGALLCWIFFISC